MLLLSKRDMYTRKDSPFEHVDTPKKAAPSKAAPKVPAGVALLAAASTGASACHVPSSFVRGFWATCRLITAPFRVFARFAAAFSFALPATVHHSHDRIAANVSRPNCSGGSYFLDWVADSGAGRSLLSHSALAEQGTLTDMFKDHIQSTKSLHFETGNGVTSSGTFLTTTSDAFGSVESYVLQSCPVVRSLGQLVELQRKPFVWLPGSMPFFGTDTDCVQFTWDSDRVIYAHKVDDFVPVFREQIKFGGDGLHRALAAGESAPAAPAEAPAPPVPAGDPPLPPPPDAPHEEPEEPPPPVPGEGSGADDEGDEDAPTKAQRLIAEAQSLQHRLTHMPKNPYCDVCNRSRMLKKRTARVRHTKGEDELDPVEEFGQRIAADFIVVHKDSRSTETVVLVEG